VNILLAIVKGNFGNQKIPKLKHGPKLGFKLSFFPFDSHVLIVKTVNTKTKGAFTHPVSTCVFRIALQFPITYLGVAQSR